MIKIHVPGHFFFNYAYLKKNNLFQGFYKHSAKYLNMYIYNLFWRAVAWNSSESEKFWYMRDADLKYGLVLLKYVLLFVVYPYKKNYDKLKQFLLHLYNIRYTVTSDLHFNVSTFKYFQKVNSTIFFKALFGICTFKDIVVFLLQSYLKKFFYYNINIFCIKLYEFKLFIYLLIYRA